MAMKKAPAKKPMSKATAMKVASFIKGQKGGEQSSSNGPALPNGNSSNPITVADDDNDED